jgi:hypothetical protein
MKSWRKHQGVLLSASTVAASLGALAIAAHAPATAAAPLPVVGSPTSSHSGFVWVSTGPSG